MKKFIKIILLPIVLLFFWIVASLITYSKISPSILTFGKGSQDTISKPSGLLVKDTKVAGDFIARENNLGMILLKFDKFIKPNFNREDILVFQLKEKGKDTWLVTNTYRSGQVETQLLFPFGFPLINDSKGKIYEFQLVSTKGDKDNSLKPSNGINSFMTGYKFNLREIIKSKQSAITFINGKVISLLPDPDYLMYSLIFLIPMLLYFVWLIRNLKLINLWKIVPIVTVSLLIINLLILKDIYIGLFLIIILGWIVSLVHYSIKSSVSFSIAIAVLILWMVIVRFNLNGVFAGLNLFAYSFLVIGVFQSIQELKKSK